MKDYLKIFLWQTEEEHRYLAKKSAYIRLPEQDFTIGFIGYNDLGFCAEKSTNDRGDDELPQLSRNHCKISLHKGKRYIHDLGSRTGTYVNGVRLSEERMHASRKLSDGDVICLIPSNSTDGPGNAKFMIELVFERKEFSD